MQIKLLFLMMWYLERENNFMSLADTITQLGSSIINVITKGIQGVADYINDNLGNVPDADGTSLSMYTFVNETAVDTLETTSKTIVGSINELKESAGGSSVDIVTTISASSTDTQVPSAKCVYDLIGNVETLLSEV